MNDRIEALEKSMIYDALAKMNGNQTQAGKLLGITERNLRYKMKKYDIRYQK
jgi:transcriptional regulator with GAF, ATPase, and Fis domain